MALNSLGCIAGILLFFGIFLILKSFNVSSGSAADSARNRSKTSGHATPYPRQESANRDTVPSYGGNEDRERRNDDTDWWEPRDHSEDEGPRPGIMDRFWDEVVGMNRYRDDEDD